MTAFRPLAGSTVNIDVSASSQRIAVSATGGNEQIRVMNNGTATVWIAFGDSSVTAALTDIPVGPGVTEVLTLPLPASGPMNVAAIAAGSTGKIYFTRGSGV